MERVGKMKVLQPIILLLMGILLQGTLVSAQQYTGTSEPVVSETSLSEQSAPKVTAVYGVTADDYLPSIEVARQHLRPNLRRSSSRPTFDLPDAFYFIGGPIFLIILLRVLVIFLNGFEESRKEEMRTVASQSPNPE